MRHKINNYNNNNNNHGYINNVVTVKKKSNPNNQHNYYVIMSCQTSNLSHLVHHSFYAFNCLLIWHAIIILLIKMDSKQRWKKKLNINIKLKKINFSNEVIIETKVSLINSF